MNEENGERVKTEAGVYKPTRSKSENVYVDGLKYALSTTRSKRAKILEYILEHKDTDNVIVATVRKIARETKISYATVVKTLQTLEKAEIIKRRQGLIMLNPKVAHKGNKKHETYLMDKFYDFDTPDTPQSLETQNLETHITE